MNIKLYIIIISYCVVSVMAYFNQYYTKSDYTNAFGLECARLSLDIKLNGPDDFNISSNKLKFIKKQRIRNYSVAVEINPILKAESIKHEVLLGRPDKILTIKNIPSKLKFINGDPIQSAHYPSGSHLRGELFMNKKGVHIPPVEFMQQGHCHLNVTSDMMQTAVDAFAIITNCYLRDIYRLPSDYVLRSARTIAMMKLPHEKFSAMWTVVKGTKKSGEITYDILEKFRPLFKYVSGRQMAKLNLTDTKILKFVGTYPYLSRHQVGSVAARYIELNANWSQPESLNQMHNLICGIPFRLMRWIPSSTYVQLPSQVFYHIRACDQMQRRFYLALMSKTETLGKAYSWSARDVYRLGLLFTELDPPDIAAINPEALSGLTPQVMLVLPSQKLQYLSDTQLKYLENKALNIYARRFKAYQDHLRSFYSSSSIFWFSSLSIRMIFLIFRM